MGYWSGTNGSRERGARGPGRQRPSLERLECRLTLSTTAVGASLGSLPRVEILDEGGSPVASFLAFEASYRGGVNVALGDVNGDGVADIIAGTDRGSAAVKVFDGTNYQQIRSFLPFGSAFRGGVNVAFGYFGSDAAGQIVTGMAHNGSQVKVFNGGDLSLTRQWTAYGRGVDGVRVAVGSLDGGFESDVVTAPGPGGAPLLKWFDVSTGQQAGQVLAYDARYRGGVEIASGDFDNNRVTDIVAIQERAANPLVRVFASGTGHPLLREFVAAGGPTTASAGVGAVHTDGGEPDRIAVSRSVPASRASGSSRQVAFFDSEGRPVGDTSLNVARGRQGLPLASAPETRFLGYSGPRADGIAYNPTWPGWFPTGNTQLEDSDFVNDAFVGLWSNSVAQGGHDLQTMHDTNFNVIRLYNWGPTRGWNASTQSGSGHLAFLSQAQSLGMKVIVPVSDFFLNNSEYSWNGQNPDANYSFESAPQAIRDDLAYFIRSITKNGQLDPAVHSISVGNELDLGIDFDPGITAKTQRALWWVVNLQKELQKQFGASVPKNFLTIPIANSDQDNRTVLKRSWFQIFLHGAKTGEATPFGAVGGATFTSDVKGLESYSWYKDWFYNSVNMAQESDQLRDTLKQYDTGVATGADWSHSWPGEKFEVPLMLTELGHSRFDIGDQAQFDIVAEKQAKVVVDYMKQSHNIMGFAIFEFNDEPNKNGYSDADPNSEVLFGIQKYYNTSNQQDFRSGVIQSTINTGTTKTSFGTFPNFALPIYQRFSVKSGDKSLLDRLKEIFAS